jgi:hypothetical protein
VSSSAQTSATALKLRGHSPSDPVMDSPPETLQSDGEWQRRHPDRSTPRRSRIGADRRAPLLDAPIRAVAEKMIIGAEDLPSEVRAATSGKDADVVLDVVGGVMFRGTVNSLAWRGRLVEIAATGQRKVSFDLADFYQMKAGFSAWTRSSATSRRHRRGAGCANP